MKVGCVNLSNFKNKIFCKEKSKGPAISNILTLEVKKMYMFGLEEKFCLYF